jgi:hypothetical protein
LGFRKAVTFDYDNDNNNNDNNNKIYFTGEITQRVAPIVNTEQLQSYIP